MEFRQKKKDHKLIPMLTRHNFDHTIQEDPSDSEPQIYFVVMKLNINNIKY